jgi:hypothetical protein
MLRSFELFRIAFRRRRRFFPDRRPAQKQSNYDEKNERNYYRNSGVYRRDQGRACVPEARDLEEVDDASPEY